MKYHLVTLHHLRMGLHLRLHQGALGGHIPLMDLAFAFCSGSRHSLRHASPHLEA